MTRILLAASVVLAMFAVTLSNVVTTAQATPVAHSATVQR